MPSSVGRKMVGVQRGLMMLCGTCYDLVVAEHLVNEKNFVDKYEEMFDTICLGCMDINRPLIDDMLGSSE
ncbi:MAG: hypothetical protein U0172_04105 [Nitrospiraceae bacterium]